MRFMVMHKMTAEMERGAPPDPEIIQGVGELVSDGLKDGVFVSGEGLHPSSRRLRLAYRSKERTLTPGPFSDAQELLSGFALLRVRSRDEAIAWCDKLAQALGDVDLWLGPVVEPWDLGMIPEPKHPPLRFLALLQLGESASGEVPADPARDARVGRLFEEMKAEGVLQAGGDLSGSAQAARIRYEAGKPRVVDGPFAESKELIAGYAILELPSRAAAIEWALRFGQVVKVEEIDVRTLRGERS